MISTIFARRVYTSIILNNNTLCIYIYTLYHWRVDSRVIFPLKTNYGVLLFYFYNMFLLVFNHTLDFVHSMKKPFLVTYCKHILYVYNKDCQSSMYGSDIFLIRWNFERKAELLHIWESLKVNQFEMKKNGEFSSSKVGSK